MLILAVLMEKVTQKMNLEAGAGTCCQGGRGVCHAAVMS